MKMFNVGNGQGTSKGYAQGKFSWRNKNNVYVGTFLIWSCAICIYDKDSFLHITHLA